jgi:lipopolysaccharide/colanic/teichoic acid biosynthesis glycosyltransferase
MIQAFDVTVTVVAFVLAFSLRTEFQFSDPDWLAMQWGIPIVAVVSMIAYHAVGLFRGTWSQTAEADLIVVVKGATLVSALLVTGMVLTNTLAEIPRSIPLIHWFITVVALYGSRMLWAKYRDAKSAADKSVALLVGCDKAAFRFLTSTQVLAGSPFKIFGLLDDSVEKARIGRTVRGTPVIGKVDRADECLALLGVHGVFPERLIVMESFQKASPERFAKLQRLASQKSMSLDIVNDSIWGDDRGDALPKETVKAARPILSAKRYMRWRRPVEWLVAMVLVGLLSPLFILLAVLCLIDVGRPVFFWQMRPGRYLKPIKLIKFRTMRSGLDKDGNALSDEQRTSTLGRIIRRSKLDELPQLLSIIRGDMSFIGPRPLLPRDQPEDAELRAIVRPGVTGWAQVNGGHPLEIEEKFALDIWYIQNASLWLDIKVIWRTLRTVLLGDRVDRAAINQAKVTRERLRPAAEKLHAGAQSSVVQALDQHKRGDKRPDGVWWPKPADSLDRAS